VRPGDRVALVLPKTTEAVVAVFASLLAGAPYVPIHPRWPKERIDFTLDDCGARAVITAPGGRLQVEWRDVSGAAEASGSAGDPALILFTSGSTGKPKGVVLSHRAVGAFVRWTVAEFQIGTNDRIASPSPLGFDLSTFDIFGMAASGATCVIVPESITWMPRFLVQFLSETRLTCWYSVPSILGGMLQEGGLKDADAPNLRLVLFAGEVFPSPQVARLQAALPDVLCANLYGPTETNVVIWHRVPKDFDGAEPLPIGKPCPYADITINAESGELLAGGESTMIGYWNRPQETARAFVEIEGKRYYRTGDRVTRRLSGDYVYVGRLDRQVKRRGFRIELGEIEAALARHPDILEAAAVAFDDSESGTVIAAFVCSTSPKADLLIEIKVHCARFLPLYMIPDMVLSVAILPKGNHGKIDYAYLKRAAEDSRYGHQS
jgi:amino acid adenylation domain-containing protein